MNIHSFTKGIDFEENRIQTKVVVETSFSKEIQILLGKGQMMKEHKAPFPILIHIVEGEIEFGIKGTSQLMTTGDIIALEADVQHDLKANKNTIVRLTLSKHDHAARVEKAIES